MALGIVRAVDQGAIWRTAAEEPGYQGPHFEPPTSTPPQGATPTSQAGPPPEVVIPNSNKFKTPANGLKNLLSAQFQSPEMEADHSSELAGWLDKHQPFAKTYFTPDYAPAIKAHLGDDLYDHMVKHLPDAHHQALTTHTQKPAPNSNKFKTPANGLKKLLESPDTTTEHVKSWMDKHPTFQTYLHPSYEQALKGHLGEKNFAELKKHLNAPTPPTELPTGPAVGKGSDIPHGTVKLPKIVPQDIYDAVDKAKNEPLQPPQPVKPLSVGEKIKALYPEMAPSAQQLDESLSNKTPSEIKKLFENTKAGHPDLAEGLQKVYDEHFGPKAKQKKVKQDITDAMAPAGFQPMTQEQALSPAGAQSLPKTKKPQGEQLSIGHQIKKLIKSQGGNVDEDTAEAWNQKSPAELKSVIQNIKKNYPNIGAELDKIQQSASPAADLSPNHKNLIQFGQDNPEWMAQHGPTLQSPQFKQWFDSQDPSYQDNSVLSPTKTMQDFGNAVGDQDEIGKIQELLSPGGQDEAAKHQALAQGIKKIFPKTTLNLDSMSVPELQRQLLNWKEHLPPENFAQFHPQLKSLYDQHFGPGAGQTPNKPLTDPSNFGQGAQPVFDKDALTADLQAVISAPNFYMALEKAQSPAAVQALLKTKIKHWQEAGMPGGAEKVQEVYDKHFGPAPSLGPQPEPSEHPTKAPGFQQWFHDEIDATPGAWENTDPEQQENLKDQYAEDFAPQDDDPEPLDEWEQQLMDQAQPQPADPKDQQLKDMLLKHYPTHPDPDVWLKSLKSNAKFQGVSISDYLKQHYPTWVKDLASQPAQGLTKDLIKQHFPVIDEASLAHWLGTGDPAVQLAKIQKAMGAELMDDKTKAKWQSIIDSAGLQPNLSPASSAAGPVNFDATEAAKAYGMAIGLGEKSAEGVFGDAGKYKELDYATFKKQLAKKLQVAKSGGMNAMHADKIQAVYDKFFGEPKPFAQTAKDILNGLGMVVDTQAIAKMGPEQKKQFLDYWTGSEGLKAYQNPDLMALYNHPEVTGGAPGPARPSAPIDTEAVFNDVQQALDVGISPGLKSMTPDGLHKSLVNMQSSWSGGSTEDAKKARLLQKVIDKYWPQSDDQMQAAHPSGPVDPPSLIQEMIDKGILTPSLVSDELAKQDPEKFQGNIDYVKNHPEQFTDHVWSKVVKYLEQKQQGNQILDSPPATGPMGLDFAQAIAKTYNAPQPELANTGGKKFIDMTPEEGKAYLLKNIANPTLTTKAKYQAIYDKFFGATPSTPTTAPIPSPIELAKEIGAVHGIGVDVNANGKKLKEMTPDEVKKTLENWLQSGAWDETYQEKYQAIYDKYFGGPGSSASSVAFDPQVLASEISSITGIGPGVNFGGQPWVEMTPEQAKHALQESIDDGGYGTPVAEYQKLYDKYFGKGVPPAGVEPASASLPFDANAFHEDYKKVFPDTGFAATNWTSPAMAKAKLDELIADKSSLGLKNMANTLTKLKDKWFGGGVAGAPLAEGPSLAWMKKHYPETNVGKYKTDAEVEKWFQAHKDSSAAQNWIKDNWGDKTQHQYSPGASPTGPFDHKTMIQQMIDNNELNSAYKGVVDQSPEEFLKNIKYVEDDPKSFPPASGWGSIYQKYKSQSGGAAAPTTPWDWNDFSSEWMNLYPKSSWGTETHTFEDAKAKLKGTYDQALSSYPGTDKTNQALALYKKYFGEPGSPASSSGDFVDPFVPTPSGGISAPIMPEEPEEEEGVSAPFKSEPATEDDLASFAATKPTTNAEFKAFSNWWGKTQLTPEQEQGIYKSWFGKDVPPEKAGAWMQKVFESYSKPGSGDLGLADMPSWAPNSWAFGKNAEKEWPVFKEWASKDPGIPKGLGVKAKLQIWNGLSAGDKKEISDNYLPKNPVDTSAVLGELQAAYPDSDFSAWAKMGQGSLKNNVEVLAKSGYDPAVPIFNKYFGGDLPDPDHLKFIQFVKDKTGKDLGQLSGDEKNKLQGAWEKEKASPTKKAKPKPTLAYKVVPVKDVPSWVSAQYGGWGSGEIAAKKYSAFQNFADSIGEGEQAKTGKDPKNPGSSYPYVLIKQWQTVPEYLQKQIGQMSVKPWTDTDTFNQWVAAQPIPASELTAITGKTADQLGYYWSKPSTGQYLKWQANELGDMIDKEPDLQKKQAMLGVYHKYWGAGKPTLGQSLKAIYPAEDWDKMLQTKPVAAVMKEIKKRLKAEKDPEKFIALVDTWGTYFNAPSGVKQITNILKGNHNNGYPVSPDILKKLKFWKEKMGSATDADLNYGLYYNDEFKNNYDAGPYVKAQMEKPKDQVPFYHGWTPEGDAVMDVGQVDPAMMASSGPTYTAPEKTTKSSKAYQTLLDSVNAKKAMYSGNDLDLLKSEEFQGWFNQSPKAYKDAFAHTPGIALDDYKAFISGATETPEVPQGGTGVYDVSPFANVPKPGQKGLLKSPPKQLTHQPHRSDEVKFPSEPDLQETLPGAQWAPNYNAMPIYRAIPVDIWSPTNGKREKIRQQIVDILEGKNQYKTQPENLFSTLPNQKWPADAPPVPHTQEQWLDVMSWAKKNKVSDEQMYDLAEQAGAADPKKYGMPPLSKTPGNFDDPRLAKLILDFLEKGNDEGPGIGIHWTRNRDKAYTPAKAIGSGSNMSYSQGSRLPISVHALWSGEGEDSQWSGGAYHPKSTEQEHTLLSGAPVTIRRLQIRDQSGDWHDLIDYGPISEWPEGRDEVNIPESVGSSAFAGPLTGEPTHGAKASRDKPSLAETLKKMVGGSYSPETWDALRPGAKTDMIFSKLLKEHPEKKTELDKIYRWFFVGRTDLHTKPHRRRASLAPLPRAASLEDTEETINILASAWDDIDEYHHSWDSPDEDEENWGDDEDDQDEEIVQNLEDRDPKFWSRPEYHSNGDGGYTYKRYYSPHEMNPQGPDSPEQNWQHHKPEGTLPFLDDARMDDRSPKDLYRGYMLDLRDPELAEIRRSLLGEKGEEFDEGSAYRHFDDAGEATPPDALFDRPPAKANPQGYNNPDLGKKLIDHLSNGHYDSRYGLGAHWSDNESVSNEFSGNPSSPWHLPVRVRADWKGTGEDPYRSETGGSFPDEHEVTMLPGAKMNIRSVQIKHPKTKKWHEVFGAPEETPAEEHYAAVQVRRPRGILTHSEMRL